MNLFHYDFHRLNLKKSKFSWIIPLFSNLHRIFHLDYCLTPNSAFVVRRTDQYEVVSNLLGVPEGTHYQIRIYDQNHFPRNNLLKNCVWKEFHRYWMFVAVRDWFELVLCMEVAHMKTIAEQMAVEFVRNFAFDSHCRSKNIIIYRRTYINSCGVFFRVIVASFLGIFCLGW